MRVDLSIVICTRNRATRLDGMLSALERLQSDHCWEVILADNNSTDNTAQVLAEAQKSNERIRLLTVKRTGLGAARDAAWRVARGEIVSFTDDDCYVAEDYVDQIVKVFQERPDIEGLGGRILLHDPTDYPITIDERTEVEEIPPKAFVGPGAIAGANMAFRRRALEQVGGLDPMLGAGTPFPCEDIDLVAAVCWAGNKQAYDPRPLVYHHHGRKEADVPALLVSYDRGRGAYFAKYLLRKDARQDYLEGWKREAERDLYLGGLVSNLRELAYAMRYLVMRKEYGFVLLAASLAVYNVVRLAGRALGSKFIR